MMNDGALSLCLACSFNKMGVLTMFVMLGHNVTMKLSL